MRNRNEDLHGNAPDRSAVAIVLIDTINDLEFDGGEQLLEPAMAAADRILELKRRARAAGVPVIYANDNFGRWRSDFRDVVEHCLRDGVRGRVLAERLAPEPEDYFVLKPKHSGFYATTLETLLDYLGATRVVLAGFSGDVCVFFTAVDAYIRDLEVFVPEDCVASVSREHLEEGLAYMRRVLNADTRPASELDLLELRKPSPS